jgi:hypothetical protein
VNRSKTTAEHNQSAVWQSSADYSQALRAGPAGARNHESQLTWRTDGRQAAGNRAEVPGYRASGLIEYACDLDVAGIVAEETL